jgi:hypothetical protein
VIKEDMMKIHVLVMFVILLIVLTGCKGGPSEQNIKDDYHKGTQGITINFINNAPPSRVYEGDDLDISIEVKNKGAYPTSNSFKGKLELSGFDPSSIRGSWDGGNSIPTDLEGKNQYNPEGGYEVMTYKARDVRVPFDADYYEPNILVHSCYDYKTTADVIVCLDPDPYKVVEEKKVCSIQNVIVGGGQGAPVAVTKIEEEVGSDQIYFRVYVSNVGGGSVMLPRSYNDCPFDVKLDDLNKITAKIKLPYDASPDCSPKGTASDPIRLNNGNGYIFCKFRKPATDSAYTTSLNVELDYSYSDSISKQIKIINIK